MAEPAPKRPPNGTVRVALRGTIQGGIWVNRFWLKVTDSGTPTAANLLALSNAVSAAWRTRFFPQLASGASLQTQRAVQYVSDVLEIGVDGTDAGSGSAAGTTMPAQVSPMVNWAIAGTYRGGHPRTYLPGLSESDFGSDGTINSGRRTGITTAANGFLADVNSMTGAGYTSVTLGTIRFFRNLSALDPPVFEPFLAGSCHVRPRTQRRRIGK